MLFNDYPSSLIDEVTTSRIKEIKNKQNKIQNLNNIRDFNIKRSLIVPYCEGFTKISKNTVKKFCLKVISKISNKLSNIFGTQKDKIDKEKRSNVIYKIDCGQCDGCWIGQTKRYFQERLNEHIRSQKNPTSYKTALSEHVSTEKHNFKFDQAKILYNAQHVVELNLSEMFFSKSHEKAVNHIQDCNKFPRVYEQLTNK